MASLDLPKLRPLARQPYEHDGQPYVAFIDSTGAAPDPILVPAAWYEGVVRHFDGETPLAEIQTRALRETGQWVSSAQVRGLVEELDRALILDGHNSFVCAAHSSEDIYETRLRATKAAQSVRAAL